jgi:hypothetical protein
MDSENSKPQKDDSANEIQAECGSILSARGKQYKACHSDGGGDNTQNKKRIAEWFRKLFGGHRPLEWLTFGFEVLTFFALCVYSYFSWGQWQAIKDQKGVMQGQLDQMISSSIQTDKLIAATQDFAAASKAQATLTHRQIVAAYGADIMPTFALRPTGIRLSFFPVSDHTLSHPQSVPAKNVRLSATVIRKHLPDMKSIAPAGSMEFHAASVPANVDHPRITEQDYRITGLDDASFLAMQNLQQTVTIKGLLTFDNGFDDIITHPICVSWLEYRFPGTPPMAGFMPCEDFPALLRKAEGLRRISEKAK